MSSLVSELGLGTSDGSGGVAILVGPSHRRLASHVDFFALEVDRVLRCRVVHPGGELVIVGVHLVPGSPEDRRELLEAIRRVLPRWDCGVGFVGGDFFSVVEGEGRFRISDGTVVNTFEAEERLLLEVFGPGFTELSQPEHTRLGMWDGSPRVGTRIDRWYSTVDVPSLLDCGASAGIVWPPEADDGMSEYALGFASVGVVRQMRPTISRWVVEDARFLGCYIALLAVAPVESDPIVAMEVAKAAFFVAAGRIRAEELGRPSGDSGAILCRCLRALRHLREGLGARARRLMLDVLKPLQPHLDGQLAEDHGMLYEEVVEIVRPLSMSTVVGEESSIAHADLPDGERSRRLARLRRRADCWSRTRPRVQMSAILRDDGTLIMDEAEATEALRTIGSPFFNAGFA